MGSGIFVMTILDGTVIGTDAMEMRVVSSDLREVRVSRTA